MAIHRTAVSLWCLVLIVAFSQIARGADAIVAAPVSFSGHGKPVYAAVVLPDGKHVASAGGDSTIRIWDVATGVQTSALTGHGGAIYGLAVSRDGTLLASASVDKSIRVWDLQSGRNLNTFTTRRTLTGVAFSPDRHYLLIGGFHGINHLYDLTAGAVVQKWPPHDGGGDSVAWSSDNRFFATAGVANVLYLWNAKTFAEVRKIQGNFGKCHALAFSPDGKYLLSGHDDHVIRLWAVETGNLLSKYAGHSADVTGLDFSPDGRQIVSCGQETAIILWDAVSGHELQRFSGHTGNVRAVSFARDGKFFASASEDGTARTWVIATPNAVPVALPPSVATVAPSEIAMVPHPLPPATVPPVSITKPAVVPASPPPFDPNVIERPEYQSRSKPIVKTLTSLTSMMVRIADEGDAMGLTADIIAAVPAGSRSQRDHRSAAHLLRKTGKEMETSFDEAIRAVQMRYPVWGGGDIEISFSDKYHEQDGGSAGAGFAVLLLSSLEGIDLDPKCAITGDITVDWKIGKVGAVAEKLHGAELDRCTYAAIPADDAASMNDMRLYYGDSALWQMQVFSIATLQDAVAVVRSDRAPQLVEAMNLFSGLQPVLAKSGRAALMSEGTKQVLQRVLELAPNHLSARCLLDLATNSAPQTLSDGATLYQVSMIAYPYRHFLSKREQVSRSTLPLAITINARRQLNALRKIANKDMSTIVLDLGAYVERAEAVAEKQAKPSDLEERRSALLAHISTLSSDRNFMEKLIRDGE